MPEQIQEPIIVAAVFGKNPQLKPVWFVWRGQKYKILKVTYSWADNEGRTKRYHFAVSDGANVYELCYDSERLIWQLVAVEMEG